MRRSRPNHGIPLLALAVAILLGALAVQGGFSQTVPPLPTFPPQATLPPLPTLPPFPTQPPLPTISPPPTEPTVPPEPPTAVPSEVPTEPPTIPPTAEPTVPPPPPPPPVIPTQPPSSPAPPEAEISCRLASQGNGATPAPAPASPAGQAPWTLYDCELDLTFGPATDLTLTGDAGTPGWRLVLAETDAVGTQGLLDASNARLELDDLEDAPAVRFLLGLQPSCTAFRAATVTIEVTAAGSGTSEAPGARRAEIPITLPADPAPTVTLDRLALSGAGAGTSAAFELSYTGAPVTCPWQVLITLDGIDAVSIDAIAGPEGLGAAATAGQVVIAIPSGPATGTVTLTLGLAGDAIAAVRVETVTFP